MTQYQNLKDEILQLILSFFPAARLESYSFEAKLRNYAIKYVGYDFFYGPHILQSIGGDESSDLAALKGLMELLERITFASYCPLFFENKGSLFSRDDLSSKYNLTTKIINNPTTNGWAIHVTKKEAAEHALLELIERHVVLKAMAMNIPPLKIENEYKEEIRKRYNFNSDFYVWKGPLNKFICVARARFLGNGVSTIYGFAVSDSPEAAKKNSLRELMYKLVAFYKDPPFGKKCKNKLEVLQDYHLNTLDPGIEAFFSHQLSVIPAIDSELAITEDLYLSEGKPDFNQKFKTELHVVKAFHPNIQPLYFDEWDSSLINPLAIPLMKFDPVGKFHIVD